MDLELDHIFILTDKPSEAGDLLVSMGLQESFRRDHPGQGTSNRRFEFSNGMLEILYVRDSAEADNGPARNMRFPERVQSNSASPFGIIFTRKQETDQSMPFSGWKYQPDYFEPPTGFLVGQNSDLLEEPLCIYAPFIQPTVKTAEVGLFKSFSHVRITVPVDEMSETLCAVQATDKLELVTGDEHLEVLTLDAGRRGLSKDFRPDLPLIINW